VLKVAIMGNPDSLAGGVYTEPGYYGNVGSLPSSLDDLVTKPGGVSSWNMYDRRGWHGPYVENNSGDFKKDAWDVSYVYNQGAKTITRYGPNGASGGGDDIVINLQ